MGNMTVICEKKNLTKYDYDVFQIDGRGRYTFS